MRSACGVQACSVVVGGAVSGACQKPWNRATGRAYAFVSESLELNSKGERLALGREALEKEVSSRLEEVAATAGNLKYTEEYPSRVLHIAWSRFG